MQSDTQQPFALPDAPPSASKSRSMSDGEATATKLSPSPYISQAAKPASQDDIGIKDTPPPATPRRSAIRGQLSDALDSARQSTPPPHSVMMTTPNTQVRQAPPSPRADHAQMYASPTSLLPRRSRGLDFSRAATSLHHSTLAEQPSLESSGTVGGRGINIPGRRGGYSGTEQTSSSLWSVVGTQDRMTVSSSLGSTQAMGSDTSSSSDDDLMDEDADESYITTPQVHKTGLPGAGVFGNPFGSPAMGSPASFQQRQRPRKTIKKKPRGPLGLGFSIASASLSRSPPAQNPRARRESITWQANQLNLSAAEGDDTSRSLSDADGVGPTEAQVRRVTTRRGNLLVRL